MKFEVSAGGIVYKKKGKEYLWLITQNSSSLAWVFPKGHIGDTIQEEKMEDAALREVKEEGGIEAKIIKKLPDKEEYFFKRDKELIKKNVHLFLMEYVSGNPNDHDSEVSVAEFISKEEILKRLTYPLDKKAFERALKLILK